MSTLGLFAVDAVVVLGDLEAMGPTVAVVLGVHGAAPAIGPSWAGRFVGGHFRLDGLQFGEDLVDVFRRPELSEGSAMLGVGSESRVVLTSSSDVVFVGCHEAANEIFHFAGGCVSGVSGVAGSARATAMEKLLGQEEMGLEIRPPVFDVGTRFPGLAFVVVEAAIEHLGESSVEDLFLGNRMSCSNGHFPDVFKVVEEILKTAGRVPRVVEANAVVVQLDAVEFRVGVEKMLEHLSQGDLRETGSTTAHTLEKDRVHGGRELGLESVLEVVVFLPLTQFFLVSALDGVDEGHRGVGGEDGHGPGVLRKEEGMPRREEVVRWARKNDAHVAMGTTAASGGGGGREGADSVAGGLKSDVGGGVGDGGYRKLETLKEIMS